MKSLSVYMKSHAPCTHNRVEQSDPPPFQLKVACTAMVDPFSKRQKKVCQDVPVNHN